MDAVVDQKLLFQMQIATNTYITKINLNFEVNDFSRYAEDIRAYVFA